MTCGTGRALGPTFDMKLVGADGAQSYSFTLGPGRHQVGRGADCALCIPSQTVSRVHAEVEVTPNGEVYITDLGSHNSTFVNSRKITSRERVTSGDAIAFGRTEFALLTDDNTQPVKSRKLANLANQIPPNSVYIPISEALKPLPARVTDKGEVFNVIFEMARLLVVTETREDMLEKALGMVAKIIPADRLLILFVDEREVYTEASKILSSRVSPQLSLSQTIVHEIMVSQNAILISNPALDPRFAERQSIIMSDMKSAMAAPLFDEGKVLGILYADTTSPHVQYTDEQVRILATCGNIIASRLANYNLLQERQEKQAMEAEMRRASQIQQALLSQTPPQVTGYTFYAFQEQSRAVGGDLYDMTILPDGRVLFMVADVAGKGLGAALLMSNVLASFRILYDLIPFHLPSLVRRVSLQLFASSAAGEFATAFIGVLDPSAGEVVFVNAGHNSPMVLSRDGSMRTLDATGFMLGAFGFGEWEEGGLSLSPGDVIVVYSDGVSEAMTPSDEEFGEARLLSNLRLNLSENPQRITSSLMTAIDSFIAGAPRSDDITLLTLKRDS